MHALAVILMSLSSAGAMAVTPSDQLAFMRDGAVWVVDETGENERKLALEPKYDRPLIWTPDGKAVIVWDHRRGGWDFWSVAIDGSSMTNLTNATSGGCRSARFSPDGTRIAFMRDDPPGVYVMNADGSDQRRLTENGHRDVAPAWSADGSRLAYVVLLPAGERRVRMEIRVVDVTGENEGVLVHSEHSADSPSWSPAGERLLYVARRAGHHVICIADSDGGDERFLSSPDEDGIQPVWSPAGKWVAHYVRREDGRHDLRVLTPDDLQQRTLVTFSGRPSLPAWSPDGTKLAYTAEVGDTSGLYVVDLLGGAPRKIAEGRITCPVWRPSKK